MSDLSKFREKIVSIWKNKEIRDKIWFSLIILVVFRLMAAVPVPGVPLDSLKDLFGDLGFGEVLSMVSGGVLENATIVAIGLGPYINASVILQLLSSVIPKLEELQKEGEQGRKMINMYTRFLTVPLAVLQSFVIYTGLRQFGIMEELGALDLTLMVATLTGGALIMMWLGELISESGLGGGSSLIIALGILAGIPGSVKNNVAAMDELEVLILVVSAIILVLAIVFITQAERQVPIQFARRVRSIGAAAESHIPLKLNQSGVMPVIFAISMLSFPQLIARFLTSDKIPDFIKNTSEWLVTQLDNPYIYNVTLVILIIVFSMFYTFIVFNPAKIAENLQKQAAFIPGVRPGHSTVQYLTASAARLSISGAVFLAVIAVLPSIAKELDIISSNIISGTGLLIVVGTMLDMKRQVESMVVTRSYESYL
ncbi:preprotein translocase subunit SecY [Candidatus Dojkabacteria bacterium]|nr:preprotein translocase subunit SecY [Candidatus Dojkabacteria bacterium]